MASSLYPLLHALFLLLLLLRQPLFSTANFHRTSSRLRPQAVLQDAALNDSRPPTRFFEVTKPIKLPNTKPCSYHIPQHDFGFTYGKPPFLVDYTPPSNCPSKKFSNIVLEFSATCKGRQFDRIFGVWLGGVELLRSCTAEPSASGIIWSVEKDITRYYSLLRKNQTLAVFLGNLVDSTYTGVYHVNISIHFYPAEENLNSEPGSSWENSASSYHSPADLILPFSRNLPLNDGLWFEIDSSSKIASKEFNVPQNAYRALLEVYVSFHENDEFWYSNLPNEYIEANNLTNTPGNGPFREVVVTLDGEVVGAIWPFTVVYTGGINPLFWRPISGIGSFDLPSYNIEITPFLGRILDGKDHVLGFTVTNALNVWYVDANLHLWLDSKSTKVEGELLKHISLPLALSVLPKMKGLNGTFFTNARRSISSSGWVKSSLGNITTNWTQSFDYSNSMVLESNGNSQTVNQIIHFNDIVLAKLPSSPIYSTKSHKKFTSYLYSNSFDDRGKGTSVYQEKVTLGFNEKKSEAVGLELSKSSLQNVQEAKGNMSVKKKLVVSAFAGTQQVYKYDGSDFCYLRNWETHALDKGSLTSILA
ncbi:Peptide-N4-(N-acetyl-beta-glucosaminyl)asparagine amidase A [Morella rubra]|uniref:Peptide-N4-(N-acetyl-beta-glucosaminyl)asparagine amidase A n=1 Tax=Morella rubra TaxID=262757 RepID=A0A6A1VU50_9ROSI|nr:Peptide-N4-(N-acetyl-beta-glucosaminyl)asparagine amidase A [Morella rubra]